MCVVCLQWEKEKLTNREALGAIGELLDFSEDDSERTHLFGLVEKILGKEDLILTDMPETITFDELSDEEGNSEG
jgi:hypothetical protein